ncbi:aromatic-ring-hydroxylating dioxygenase subunit beta [Amycolatopsis jiangsuensis]|uniref:3-phenylpropionate/cinnamic acid dioxygenase small subunit n=1 Tax=Amycolatopsis jiangsuensis TaxID=1181879 RepID=A0A840IPP5_9PSEU|nr:3-phenylpropionate/cinnamic acid dioxygenase subunit beta [Amycolatopsis jiangsuensis]MBB4684356.1 3-phenylpropionate/cinnamic acid dioxygenase small subunit [Amycolatopsis jiangsuensis]
MTTETAQQAQLTAVLLQHEVEQFYYHEAALLDAHRYEDWVLLFTEDTHYFMPLRRTVTRRQLHLEFTKPGEMAFFDEDKNYLEIRARKFATGTSWAEDPPSRTRHLITNVHIAEKSGDELQVHSNFLLYRTRLKNDVDQWVGRREDTLRFTEAGLAIAKRHIFLDQTVLQSANLSSFF